eukprot:g1833.t1
MTYHIVLLYKYTWVSDVKKLTEWFRSRCKFYNLSGRVLVATEGVNANLASPNDEPLALSSFLDELRCHPMIGESVSGLGGGNNDGEIDFKMDKSLRVPFLDLKISEVAEIVSSGGNLPTELIIVQQNQKSEHKEKESTLQDLSKQTSSSMSSIKYTPIAPIGTAPIIQEGGKHLTPEEFHNIIGSETKTKSTIISQEEEEVQQKKDTNDGISVPNPISSDQKRKKKKKKKSKKDISDESNSGTASGAGDASENDNGTKEQKGSEEETIPQNNKRSLFGDDDDVKMKDQSPFGGSAESGDLGLLPVEKAASSLDAATQLARDAEKSEMMEGANTLEKAELQELQQENFSSATGGPTSSTTMATRESIEHTIAILQDFRNRREPNISRSDYVARLVDNLSQFFDYSKELITLFLNIFSPIECLRFLEANDQPRAVVLRCNTLKTTPEALKKQLTGRGVRLRKTGDWSSLAYTVLQSSVPVGATPEYLAGHYMLQAASSMLPVIALEPRAGDRVLDMAAAPGGKAQYLAALMQNRGALIANDFKKKRTKSLLANLHRMGVRIAVITNYDGRAFPKVMSGFDRVLLDAPCSGLGVIARDHSVKTNRTLKDIQRCAHIQKELLLSAIDSVDARGEAGGYVVYSTCSIAVEENEDVIEYALARRNVKIVDSGLDFGVEGKFYKRI